MIIIASVSLFVIHSVVAVEVVVGGSGRGSGGSGSGSRSSRSGSSDGNGSVDNSKVVEVLIVLTRSSFLI